MPADARSQSEVLELTAEETSKVDLDSSNRDENEKRPFEVEVASLYFDPENPRLAEYPNTGTQASLFGVLEKEFDLQPLADSMYRSGFFWEEPLVVVKEPLAELQGKEGLIVIEGNRRLGALRSIFRNPEAYPNDEWRERLLKIPVIQRTDRDETLAYVGFRHITGIVPWESAAKAQYAHSLVKRGSNLEEISQLIGDKTRDIARWVRTQSLVELAKDNGLEQGDAAKTFYFSYLLTATDAPSTKKWLSLELDSEKGTVEELKIENLIKLWSWLYGSKSKEISPVVPESRQIHKLNRVLGNPKAVSELEKTGDLEKALIETKSPSEYLVETLGKIRSLSMDLSSFAIGFDSISEITDDFSVQEDATSELKRSLKHLADVQSRLGL